jgi:hypothetical protein
MTDNGSFQISQGLDVLKPRSGPAYPIPCKEWNQLKSRIGILSSDPWFFHTIGSLLFGASITSILPIIFGTFSLPSQQRTLDIAWAVVICSALSGALCLIFANKERSAQRVRASEIVAQMELIEERYEGKIT